MSKAQTDIRTTSYDAATANAVGYSGTIEEALEQIRAEPDVAPTIKARAELLRYLGADKPKSALSGTQRPAAHMPAVYILPLNEDEDWTVQYGQEQKSGPGFYTLEYATQRWPQNFSLEPGYGNKFSDDFSHI